MSEHPRPPASARAPTASARPSTPTMCRELLDLYERSPGEHPQPDGPFHLNEYLANRAFGGPEEGGWWYDTGTRSSPATAPTRPWTRRPRPATRWPPGIAERRLGCHPPDSVLCTGWPELRIEPHAGADFPRTRPRYE